jgi:hypothetical protein
MQRMKSKNDARMKISAHITDFFMEFTSIDGLDNAAINELEEEAVEQSTMLMESMGLEVDAIEDGAIRVTLRLQDVGTYMDAYLDSKIVEDPNL